MSSNTANKSVSLLDLKAQYKQIQTEVEQAVIDVLRSGYYVLGPNVQAFEKEAAEFLKTKHAIGCANGSDALYIALLALDIKPEDEVIVPPFTYVATAEAVTQAGAKPVFADINLETFNIDPKEIEKKITNKTKAIIVVHLYGQACQMDEIMALARKHNLKVIEDTAQAFGTTYTSKQSSALLKAQELAPSSRHANPESAQLISASMSMTKDEHNAEIGQGSRLSAGCIADIGTYSFYPTKNLSCAGDGGMMTTNSDELHERLRKIRAHGSSVRYYHDELGVNSRLDEIQAAILRIKLKHIASWNARRGELAEIYNKAFSELDHKDFEIITPAKIPESNHIYHQYSIKIKSKTSKSDREMRDAIKNSLKERSIATEIYYPLALHAQNIYKPLGYKDIDLPNSIKATESVLCLPIYPELDESDIEAVISGFTSY
jgi:dTDP-4-amino-4,6-dideoxygalactose transaminase